MAKCMWRRMAKWMCTGCSTGADCGRAARLARTAAHLREPDRHAFHHDCLREHPLHAGWNDADSGLDALYGPITISTTPRFNAIASAPGYVQSAVSSATFSFQPVDPAARPITGVHICSPSAGSTVSSPVQVIAFPTVTGTISPYAIMGGRGKEVLDRLH